MTSRRPKLQSATVTKKPNSGAQAQLSSVSELPNVPAVYALYGGRGRRLYVAYVGIARNLKRRVAQHLTTRDSSVATRTSAAGINPDYVTQVGWWEHPKFHEERFLEAAELIAFDVLDPVLRSRGAGTARAKQTLEDAEDFREAVRSMFEGEPTGILPIPTLQDALERLAEVERRLSTLEQALARDDT
jgi:hypothetical protein